MKFLRVLSLAVMVMAAYVWTSLCVDNLPIQIGWLVALLGNGVIGVGWSNMEREWLFKKKVVEEDNDHPVFYYNEHVVPDDYPIYPGYYYICDGEVYRSVYECEIRAWVLKSLNGFKEVRKCDIVKRGLLS